jgi:hypothetical protein
MIRLAAESNNELFQKKSRDNKTPLELFVAGVQGWEARLLRQLENSKSK